MRILLQVSHVIQVLACFPGQQSLGSLPKSTGIEMEGAWKKWVQKRMGRARDTREGGVSCVVCRVSPSRAQFFPAPVTSACYASC